MPARPTTYHDLVITTLADENVELRERIRDLGVDRDAYRLLAQEAIHALARLTRERDCLRRRNRDLRELRSREGIAA